jgi:hypothetical protein
MGDVRSSLARGAVFVDLAPGELLENLPADVLEQLTLAAAHVYVTPHPDVQWIYQTERSVQVAKLLGPSANRRALDAMLAPFVAPVLALHNTRNDPRETADSALTLAPTSAQVSERMRQLCALRWDTHGPSDEHNDVALLDELRALLCNPLLADSTLRAQGCAHIVAHCGDESISIFADILHITLGALGHQEASALGTLRRRGVTRWGVHSPFAVEITDPRDDWTRELHQLASPLGSYEQLFDQRGATVHRFVSPHPPALAQLQAHAHAPHPLQRLLEALAGWTQVRVWIAGVALPAALPWSQWCAIL